MVTTGYKPPIYGRAAACDIFVELLILDEAERLNSTALELLRDRHYSAGTQQ